MKFFNKKGTSNSAIENGANKKIRKSGDVTKLKEKIIQEQAEIKETLAEIGKIYCEMYRDDADEKLVPLCNVVEESKRIIGLCEKQMLLLQGIKLCTNCKAHVSLDSLFCNKCGSKILSDDELENGALNASVTSDAPLEPVNCRECGSTMPGDTIFCTNCGAKIK